MYPLDKWHKGNPIVWLLAYFAVLLIFVIVGVVLSPLDIGRDLIIDILSIGLHVAEIAFAVLIVFILASLALNQPITEKKHNNHKHNVPRNLCIKLRFIRFLSSCSKHSLILKNLSNVIKPDKKTDDSKQPDNYRHGKEL